MALDANGVKLKGVVKTTSNMGARVLWEDGTLYVGLCSSDGKTVAQLLAFECDEPVRWGGGWQATIDGKLLMILRPTCGCQKCKALRSLSKEEFTARTPELV